MTEAALGFLLSALSPARLHSHVVRGQRYNELARLPHRPRSQVTIQACVPGPLPPCALRRRKLSRAHHPTISCPPPPPLATPLPSPAPASSSCPARSRFGCCRCMLLSARRLARSLHLVHGPSSCPAGGAHLAPCAIGHPRIGRHSARHIGSAETNERQPQATDGDYLVSTCCCRSTASGGGSRSQEDELDLRSSASFPLGPARLSDPTRR